MDLQTQQAQPLKKSEKLRAYIELKHHKQSGLAKELGISPTNFNQKLFDITHHFSEAEYQKLEEFLGIKIDQL